MTQKKTRRKKQRSKGDCFVSIELTQPREDDFSEDEEEEDKDDKEQERKEEKQEEMSILVSIGHTTAS